MKKSEQAEKALQIAYKQLAKAAEIIESENKDGKQFDYVNAPGTSEIVSKVYNRAKFIDDIFYQTT